MDEDVVAIGVSTELPCSGSVDCCGVSFKDSVTLGGSSAKPREKLSESDAECDAAWFSCNLDVSKACSE